MFRTLLGALGMSVMLAFASSANAVVWTAVGGTGSIEDTALGTYFSGGTSLAFRLGATGTVAADYNVINPTTSNPSWTTFELTSKNPGGSAATYANATLYRMPRGGTTASSLCFIATPATGVTTTSTCTFSSSFIDFNNYYYFVRVTLGRDSTSSVVSVFSMRVY